MALTKQNLNINFQQGLDTKTDPYQVPAGKFLSLQNSVFNKGGMLQKRNGFGQLASLPDSSGVFATTFNGDLTVIGSSLQAYSSGSNSWVNKGTIKPLELNTLPLIRNNTSQTQADSAIASNGIICTVYTDQDPSNLANKLFKYAVADSVTGQNLVAPTVITNADVTPGNALGTPKVFLLGSNFIVVYTQKVGGVYHLQYIAISTSNPAIVTAPANITTDYAAVASVSWDGYVFSNSLYLAWNRASAAGINMAIIGITAPGTANPVSATVLVDASHSATIMSVTADEANSIIWASYYNPGAATGYTVAVDVKLSVVLVPTIVISTFLFPLSNITSHAVNGVNTVIYEFAVTYGYDAAIPSHVIGKNTVTQAGIVGSNSNFLRSVGLASKAFVVNSTVYILVAYSSPYQPTYFLSDLSGNITAKLAYQNGGGYLTNGLPLVTVNGNEAQVSYLFKDLIQSVNKNTNVPSGSQVAGIYSQLGINLASFTIGDEGIVSAEIGNNLNLSGGFLWSYDGYSPVEQNFFIYPDSVEVTPSAAGGSMATGTYFYQVTYEWTDNQGNAFRSAPSIPVSTPVTGPTGSVAINVPTLRLTYKTANPVKIVVYRWSIAQSSYYQVTSIIQPTLNTFSADFVTITDTLSDAAILGNNLLYTTGGVVENIGPPATNIVTLFDDRLWLVDAEDQNLLWFSKQVIEATPVEMSDLFTIFVAPTTAAQGSTGPITALSAMDDKLIVFKKDAIYYINGFGPDNTGANNQYGQPILITSTVGCANPNSILFMPEGLMFQSDKGIWLLSRNLSTQYIGAPVEQFNSSVVFSSVNIPATNQVRFTLDNGVTLMYDYYYGQWGTFINIPAISSTLYQGLHTFINSLGQVYQETPSKYLDGTNPVLMSFTTSWLNLAGLQGYQRAYYVYLLGTYLSPHKLNVLIAYDYNASATQQSIIEPTNFAPVYGQDLVYGSGNPYGGPGNIERWRIFLATQRCQSFQVSVNELYDPRFGVAAGPGLTLSGLNIVAGMKRGFSPMRADQSVG